jgi:hypothetical protein
MSPELIAFSGEFEVIEAAWSLANGRTATFRICGEAFGRNHPFKKFQQRRSGRVGTRFHASFVSPDSGESINIELMLCSWKDSSSIGQTVAFWLDNDSSLHPFAGCAYRKGSEPGDVFAVAIVELTDDDQPVRQDANHLGEVSQARPVPEDPRPAAAAEGLPAATSGMSGDPAVPQNGRGGSQGGTAGNGRNRRVPGKPSKLSSLAHRTVTNPQFVQFLRETKPNTAKWTPEIARRYAKTLIQVESLSDLDRDPAAAERFRNMIGKPYDQWRYQYPM